MRNFFSEFKKFITRGNVMDMAVGVIVGGAFTAIVNGLSNFVLKPIINWILALMLGQNSLSNIHTFLTKAYKLAEDGSVIKDELGAPVIDLANSIYIDWGSLINAIINFLLIAIVLFTIVRMFNRIKEGNDNLKKSLKKITKEDRKELKARGIKLSNTEAVKAYFAEKEALAKAEEEKAKLEAEEKARQERLANPTTEDLLKEMLAIMKKEA
jgi:large conductance mechanosensitive channel